MIRVVVSWLSMGDWILPVFSSGDGEVIGVTGYITACE